MKRMSHFKTISILTLSALFLFTGAFFSHAQDYSEWVMENWNKDKEEVFKTAKEQDKFILLFVGRPTCGACQDMSEMLCNPDNPFKQILDDNYITWYKFVPQTDMENWFEDEDSKAEVFEYIEEFYEERLAGLNRQLPWLYIINPDREGESVASSYRPTPEYRPDEETMRQFLAVDLLESNNLDWYVAEYKVFELAREQKKYIFKFRGNGASPNSQRMITLLQNEPLKQLLEENYILWYEDESDCGCDIILSAPVEPKDTEDDINLLPYISIIDPRLPDHLLEELWGVQDVEILEGILKKYTVSIETISTANKVFVAGNQLLISNQTIDEQINIYSVAGQVVMTVRKNDFNASIDLSNLPKGVFVIHSSAGWIEKVVKQ